VAHGREARLTEILGPAALERDRETRLRMFRGPFDEEWTSYPHGKAIVTVFVKGINAYITLNADNLPLNSNSRDLSPISGILRRHYSGRQASVTRTPSWRWPAGRARRRQGSDKAVPVGSWSEIVVPVIINGLHDAANSIATVVATPALTPH
jgi:hypothetical protein